MRTKKNFFAPVVKTKCIPRRRIWNVDRHPFQMTAHQLKGHWSNAGSSPGCSLPSHLFFVRCTAIKLSSTWADGRNYSFSSSPTKCWCRRAGYPKNQATCNVTMLSIANLNNHTQITNMIFSVYSEKQVAFYFFQVVGGRKISNMEKIRIPLPLHKCFLFSFFFSNILASSKTHQCWGAHGTKPYLCCHILHWAPCWLTEGKEWRQTRVLEK